MYGINELNNHMFTFESVLNLPLPLFQDYVEYQLAEKKKLTDKQKRETSQIMKNGK